MVNFLLVKDDPNFIQIKNNFSQYKYTKDFSYLIPPIEMYRDIIEEYTLKTSKLIEITSLNQQISSLTQQLNHFKTFSTAKQRIQNQLPYRLGQAMIINSKNFLGYIFLPYILLSIVILYKQEQKNYKHKIKLNPESTLPPLETYPDYNEALKEKRCFTYKLGLALIEANKKWYGGGYIKLWFKIKK
ncbi:alpha-2,3-sialyltransferase, partial [Campylobacter jejuni]|nr:alpha-2,3-sialyltransferase [Campylobacter jejuni]